MQKEEHKCENSILPATWPFMTKKMHLSIGVDGCERVFKRNDKFVAHQLSHNITKVCVNVPKKVKKIGLQKPINVAENSDDDNESVDDLSMVYHARFALEVCILNSLFSLSIFSVFT